MKEFWDNFLNKASKPKQVIPSCKFRSKTFAAIAMLSELESLELVYICPLLFVVISTLIVLHTADSMLIPSNWQGFLDMSSWMAHSCWLLLSEATAYTTELSISESIEWYMTSPET